jgi:C_GCAxxG_C_C family probable redox protein
MLKSEALRTRLEELEARDWNLSAIETRFNRLVQEGIPKKTLNQQETISRKQEILDRVQRRGEEYCYLTRNCAKGSTLALLEEFGLGNMEMIRALAPFPGFGMTGGICGAVTGGLIALSLYFSNENIADFQDLRANLAARKFTRRFEESLGSLFCPKVQEFILGKYYDPMAGPENNENFNKAKARQKCPLAPGLGARIATEIIIESMEKNKAA